MNFPTLAMSRNANCLSLSKPHYKLQRQMSAIKSRTSSNSSFFSVVMLLAVYPQIGSHFHREMSELVHLCGLAETRDATG